MKYKIKNMSPQQIKKFYTAIWKDILAEYNRGKLTDEEVMEISNIIAGKMGISHLVDIR